MASDFQISIASLDHVQRLTSQAIGLGISQEKVDEFMRGVSERICKAASAGRWSEVWYGIDEPLVRLLQWAASCAGYRAVILRWRDDGKSADIEINWQFKDTR